MPSTKLLKERIESIQDTMKITNAMYLISSSKLRKARKNYQAVSPYFERMQMTMTRVLPHLPEEPVHPFFHTRNPESPRRAYLVLTADKGMAGAYNQNLLKFLKSHCGDDPKARFYVVGQTGYRALLHKDPRLVEDFLYSGQAPTLQRARDITADMIDTFKADEVDEVYLIYTKIQNALTAEPVMLQLLPLERSHFAPLPPALGDPHGEVELFPDAWSVFKQMAPIYMHGMIFGAMTESFCAEQSARMTAMDSATKSANDMIRDLQLEYNRTRQGSITQEITEVSAGAKAQRDGDLIVPADWGAIVPERANAVYDSHFDRSCMIGNSLVEGFLIWSGVTNMKYIYGTGAVVNNVLGTLDLSPLTLNDADYYHDIYLMFGLNEVGTDVNAFVQSYKTLIEYVREHQTKANIYVISVTPVTQKVDADPNEVQSMDRINAFNSALKQLCADEKCWYLDIYSMLVDEYGYLSSNYAFAGDGKHFEKSGYVAWANYMKTHYVDEDLLTE